MPTDLTHLVVDQQAWLADAMPGRRDAGTPGRRQNISCRELRRQEEALVERLKRR